MAEQTAAATVSRAFVRAAKQPLNEHQLLEATDNGLRMVLMHKGLRYAWYDFDDPMLYWWAGRLMFSVKRELPYMNNEPGCRWLLACESDQCIAFGCVDINRQNVATLRHDYVHPEYRRRGIATALVTQRVEYGRAMNVAGFTATVNKTSLPIYRRAGFKPGGTRGRYTQMVRTAND